MTDTTDPTAPESVPSPRLIGRDEMNLAEFPMALLADRVPRGQKTLHFEDQHGRLTVTGSDAYGLPTAADADVIVALIYLTKLRTEFQDIKVNFSRYELIKLLGWPDEGGSYKRLDLSFNRWAGVLLVFDKCWWNNKLKRYCDAKFHIIESVEIVDGDTRRSAHVGGQNGLPLSSFTWSRKFIESCQANNIRRLDLEEYFSLKSAISKRLYRFLGKRFHLRGEWTFDLNEIAFERVGLSRGYQSNAGKIKEKLRPAIAELEAIGFLQPLSREERYGRIDRGRWTIRLDQRSSALASPPPSLPAATEPEPSGLVAALIERGVTRATAAGLVERHPAARIAHKLEVFDWLTAQQDKRVARSPAGYLVTSVEQDYADPKGFVPNAEREQRAAAQRARERDAAEAQRQERERDARERAKQQRDVAYWNALTEAERDALDAASRAQADPETLALEARSDPMARRIGQYLRRSVYIRQLLDRRDAAAAADPE